MNKYQQFQYYYNLYYEHYCRDIHMAYKKPSNTKVSVYIHHTVWLKKHKSSDDRCTVLCCNLQSFTLGCVYQVCLDDSGRQLSIFRVVTPSKVYEWYISGDYKYAMPIAVVPQHRVTCHNNVAYADYTEKTNDNLCAVYY